MKKFDLKNWYLHYLSESIPEDALNTSYLRGFIEMDGSLTERGSHEFCRRSKLPKDLVGLLCKSNSGEAFSETEVAQIAALKRCKLIDANNVITNFGLMKLVESYSLDEQVKYLGIKLLNIELRKDPLLSHELNAISYLKNIYPDGLIFHDEGNIIGVLFYISIIAKYESLLKHSSFPPERIEINERSLLGLDAWAFSGNAIEFVCDEIMCMSKETFYSGYSLIKKMSEDLEQHLQRGDMSLEFEYLWKVFQFFGTSLLSDLLRMRESQPFLSFPDLTILSEEGVSYIEVKVKDKLSFNQIRTFSLLKKMQNKHKRILELCLLKLTFID